MRVLHVCEEIPQENALQDDATVVAFEPAFLRCSAKPSVIDFKRCAVTELFLGVWFTAFQWVLLEVDRVSRQSYHIGWC